MTKQDFINRVGSKTGLSSRDAGKAVDAFMEVVTETLKSGDSINFTGFGKLRPHPAPPGRASTLAPASACRSRRRSCRSSAPGGQLKAALKPPGLTSNGDHVPPEGRCERPSVVLAIYPEAWL